ncbi:hypothetical protein B0H19DRAFT_1079027 [Mycena capillaripes]|nr:hypothetical protein B0H19DRAFT_1079027 [Mycena capillaripes]
MSHSARSFLLPDAAQKNELQILLRSNCAPPEASKFQRIISAANSEQPEWVSCSAWSKSRSKQAVCLEEEMVWLMAYVASSDTGTSVSSTRRVTGGSRRQHIGLVEADQMPALIFWATAQQNSTQTFYCLCSRGRRGIPSVVEGSGLWERSYVFAEADRATRGASVWSSHCHCDSFESVVQILDVPSLSSVAVLPRSLAKIVLSPRFIATVPWAFGLLVQSLIHYI